MTASTLVIIDASLESAFGALMGDDSYAVLVLDSQSDGIAQISAYLSQVDGLDAIHLISHGGEGEIRLGSSVLDAVALSERADDIAAWGAALAEGGDILVYGCDVAAGTDGMRFIGDLAALTSADVAASTDATGNAAAGGNWILEARTGDTAAALALDSFSGLLATGDFIVGDGSGGGGGSSQNYSAPGGAGGGDNDTLTGGSGNDVIIGDGSGGGGSAGYSGGVGAGGAGGGGADSITGGAGDDILIGDGFNGQAGNGINGGDGGYGGGGGGAAGASYGATHLGGTGGDGGIGGGGGGGGWSETGNAGSGGSGGIGGGGGGGGGDSGTAGSDGTLSGSASGGGPGAYISQGRSGAGGAGYFGTGGQSYSDIFGWIDSGGDGAAAGTGGGNGGTSSGYVGGNTPIIAAGGGGGFGNASGGSGAQYGNATAGGAGDTSVYTMPDSSGAVWTQVDTDLGNGTLAGLISTLGTGAGADTLNGGAGSDQLLGLGGADVFVIDSADAGTADSETIWDYNAAQGDQIQLLSNGATLDGHTLSTLLAAQTSSGDDRSIVFGTQTVVVKGIGRDLTTADFLAAPSFAGDADNNGVYDTTVTVNENATLTLASVLGVQEDDSGQTVTWSQASGPSGGALTLSGTTANAGSATVSPAGTASYTPTANTSGSDQFTVTVTDSSGATDSMTVNVTVANVVPVLASTSLNLPESTAAGTALLTLDTSGGDQNGLTNWQITSGNTAGLFSLSNGVLSVASGVSLDYESMAHSYTLGVSVDDEIGASGTATITVNLTNVNETPGTVSLTPGTVTDAMTAGGTVGTLSASDPDGDTLTYTVTSGAASFAVTGSTLTLAQPLAAGSHAVTVQASDPGGLTSTNSFTVTVSDATAPTLVSNSPASNATSIGLGAAISLTFSETVALGTGSISLTRGGVVVESFDVATGTGTAGGTVAVTGRTVTITPGAAFAYGQTYGVDVAAGTVADTAGNAFAGASLAFSTEAAPVETVPDVSFQPGGGIAGHGSTSRTSDPDQAETLVTAFLAGAGGMSETVQAKIADYLQALNGASVAVSTYTLTGSGGGTVISGQSTGNELVVIDASALPPGTALELQNIAFAIIIGPVAVSGGSGNNMAVGGPNAQYMVLGVGDDTLMGGAGADTIGSADGNDLLFGNEGGDLVYGGIGNDSVFGGKDDDGVLGDDGDDGVSGDTGNDWGFGGAGSDTVRGGDGNDILYGNQGSDALYGNQGTDVLYGGKDADSLHGGRDADALSGDDGNDTLSGDDGADTLIGGAGADVFVYAGDTQGGDVIADFTSGSDTIAVWSPSFGNLAAGVLDTRYFALAGQETSDTRFVFNTATGALSYDADGSGDQAGTTLATLTNGATLSAGDILVLAG